MIHVHNLAAALLSVCCVIAADEPDAKPAVVADQEILAELKSAPKENRDRVQRIRELYLQAGAAEDDVRLQEVKLGDRDETLQHNVIATKKGASDSVIVVGGHLDKVPPGDGIIDDWSGACLATNLYQTLLPTKTHHTFVFIGFAHEEHGLVGSRAYVASLSEDERKRVKAMVNLEVLGVADPFIWTNGSTDSLEVIAHRVAREHKLPLRDHVIVGVGADSMSFGQVGIPNITFDGLPLDKIRLIHSDQDTFENINPEAYLNAYRFTSRYLVTLDRDLAARPDLLNELDPKTAGVDEYVEAELKRRHIPGLSVAVVRGGEVLVAKGYGMANLELSVAASADSVYQIGSVLAQMWTTTKLADGKEKDYGFGWGVGSHRGHRLIGHGGGIPGFAADISRFVDDRLTVIVLANLENSNPGAMARAIAGLYVPDLAVADRPIEDKDPKTTEFFKKVLATTTDGTIDAELFTPEMRKEVFPDRMKQASVFLKRLGPLKSFTLVEHKQDGGRRSYRYQVAFGETTLILSGTLTEDGKIAGLLLTPE